MRGVLDMSIMDGISHHAVGMGTSARVFISHWEVLSGLRGVAPKKKSGRIAPTALSVQYWVGLVKENSGGPGDNYTFQSGTPLFLQWTKGKDQSVVRAAEMLGTRSEVLVSAWMFFTTMMDLGRMP